jgi:hypothetical protein
VPVDPQRGIVSSLAFGAAVLKRERILIWFPEAWHAPCTTAELGRYAVP